MRDELAGARRVVVKVGSSSLTTAEVSTRDGSSSLSTYSQARGWRAGKLSWCHPVPSPPGSHRSDSESALVISPLSKRLHPSDRAC